MTTTALLTHPHALSLVTLTKFPNPQLTTNTPLPLPSRFPASSSPLTDISPNGHVFLYALSGAFVWEYDPAAAE